MKLRLHLCSDGFEQHCMYILIYQNKTSVSETIRKPSLVKGQTALKNKIIKYGEKRFSIWRMELLHPATWHDHDIWFRQVTAPCNVACGSGITTVNSPRAAPCSVTFLRIVTFLLLRLINTLTYLLFNLVDIFVYEDATQQSLLVSESCTTVAALDISGAKANRRTSSDLRIYRINLTPATFLGGGLNDLSISYEAAYPSYASAEACLTWWPNAQPQGWD